MQTSYNWHAAEAVSWQTVQKASSMRLSPCGLPKPLQNALHQLCCLQHDPQQRSRLLVHQKIQHGKMSNPRLARCSCCNQECSLRDLWLCHNRAYDGCTLSVLSQQRPLADAGMGKRPPSTNIMLHQMVNHCGCTCMAMISPVEPTLVRNLMMPSDSELCCTA